jgi:hypothetical protein
MWLTATTATTATTAHTLWLHLLLHVLLRHIAGLLHALLLHLALHMLLLTRLLYMLLPVCTHIGYTAPVCFVIYICTLICRAVRCCLIWSSGCCIGCPMRR